MEKKIPACTRIIYTFFVASQRRARGSWLAAAASGPRRQHHSCHVRLGASSGAMLVQAQGCGSSMAASPSTSGRLRAATCRRWGDVGVLSRVARREARRHYFTRLAKRSLRDRWPALPFGGKPCASLCSSPIAASRPPYVRSRAVTALALGNVFLPWLFRAQLTVHSRCARH